MTDVVLRPVPGNGVLARFGELVLLCGADQRYEGQVAALLDAVADVAAGGGDGRQLGRRLAGLLGAAGLDGEEFPPLCALGSTGRDLAVLVHGSAVVEAVTGTGPVRLAGNEAVTWVDRVLTGPVRSVRAILSEADSAAPPDWWARLDSGVIRAGGLLLGGSEGDAAPVAAVSKPAAAPQPLSEEPAAAEPEPLAAVPEPEPVEPVSEPVSAAPSWHEPDRTAPSAEPEPTAAIPAGSEPDAEPEPTAAVPATVEPVATPTPEPAPTPVPAPEPEPAPAPEPARVEVPRHPIINRDAPFEAVLLVGGQAERPQASAPLPPAGEAPRADAPDAGPTVLGIYCKNDHFNDPRAPYCAVCGISMVQATHVARPGPRPPLGVLVLDDGATFRLDAPYVVGREPERDGDVVEGRARALRIMDRDGVVSRVHARVELDGWDIKIIDLGSANGTQVSDQGRTPWVRIPPRTPVPIRPGTRVLFGHRGVRYESHRNP